MFSLIKRNFSKPKGIIGVMTGKIMAQENKVINKWTISRLGIRRGDKVLEVGYGPGYALEYILDHYPVVRADGLDISETMKELASKRLRDSIDAGKTELMTADIGEANLPDHAYHKILSVNNYTIWDEPRNGLSRLFDALIPGGTIAITMQPREENASPNKTKMFGKQIYDDMRACGFERISMKFKRVKPEMTVCVTARKPRGK
ncbi:methyltransferase domain-containing protein [Bacillus mangrovi]|uniref:Methyltransferase domain-containing protein n=1 Tax=Metabacillus mangrovi TaxID=1491830 RepID=A0A7X2S893_9BACI|nr:class I SAM-dependent methyltransferase [Metabacillus mangrovi]MTH55192.1 methyltransferase domain-containing protein [Metabacillus mangrovi]